MSRIDQLEVTACRVPTEAPESDGTYRWDSTTMVLVEARSGGMTGIGYTYADASAATLIASRLAPLLTGRNPQDISACWEAMVMEVRNAGRPGIAAMAISAVDAALWDLKARMLGVSLAGLLGRVREGIPVYGSGGFTSDSPERLQEQLGGWVSQGLGMVKMKVGRHPDRDLLRVRLAREAIGEAQLFVDANGAYTRKQALEMAEGFAGYGVRWFEEPVSSDDLEGLRLLRDRAPAGMAVAAGEYGDAPPYFRRMLEAGAVDVLQVDATRCMGVTGFLKAAALAEAFMVPLSAHTAPTLHAPLCCAVSPAVHLEYFHDHVRIEQRFFDGALAPESGELRPDPARPGLGVDLKRQEAMRYAL